MRIIETSSGCVACLSLGGSTLTARGATRDEAIARLKDIARNALGIDLG